MINFNYLFIDPVNIKKLIYYDMNNIKFANTNIYTENLIYDSDFQEGFGKWIENSNSSFSYDSLNKNIRFTYDGANDYDLSYTFYNLKIGKTYKFVIKIENISNANIKINENSTFDNLDSSLITENGEYIYELTASDTSNILILTASGSLTGDTLDIISTNLYELSLMENTSYIQNTGYKKTLNDGILYATNGVFLDGVTQYFDVPVSVDTQSIIFYNFETYNFEKVTTFYDTTFHRIDTSCCDVCVLNIIVSDEDLSVLNNNVNYLRDIVNNKTIQEITSFNLTNIESFYGCNEGTLSNEIIYDVLSENTTTIINYTVNCRENILNEPNGPSNFSILQDQNGKMIANKNTSLINYNNDGRYIDTQLELYNEDFTISFVFKILNNNKEEIFGNSENGFLFKKETDNNINFYIGGQQLNCGILEEKIHLFTVTFNKDLTTAKVYINDIFITENTSTNITDFTNILIGKTLYGSSFLQNDLGFFTTINKELNESEINNIFKDFYYTYIELDILNISENIAGSCDYESGNECEATSEYSVNYENGYGTLIYNWEVENATLVSGQGTDTITVSTTSDTDVNFNISVSITDNFVTKNETNSFTHLHSETLPPPSYEFVEELNVIDNYYYVYDSNNEEYNGKLCNSDGSAFILTTSEYPKDGTLDLPNDGYILTNWKQAINSEWYLTASYDISKGSSFKAYTLHYKGNLKADVYYSENGNDFTLNAEDTDLNYTPDSNNFYKFYELPILPVIPTGTITVDDVELTENETTNVNFEFNIDVNLTLEKIISDYATVSNLTGSGKSYTAVLTPFENTNKINCSVRINAGELDDGFGNLNTLIESNKYDVNTVPLANLITSFGSYGFGDSTGTLTQLNDLDFRIEVTGTGTDRYKPYVQFVCDPPVPLGDYRFTFDVTNSDNTLQLEAWRVQITQDVYDILSNGSYEYEELNTGVERGYVYMYFDGEHTTGALDILNPKLVRIPSTDWHYISIGGKNGDGPNGEYINAIDETLTDAQSIVDKNNKNYGWYLTVPTTELGGGYAGVTNNNTGYLYDSQFDRGIAIDTDNDANFVFTNLDDGEYSIKVSGSLAFETADRYIRISYDTQSYDLQIVNNYNDGVEFTNIVPVNGEITITVKKLQADNGYISGFNIRKTL